MLRGFRASQRRTSAPLKDGYLTISAEKAVEETQEAEKEGPNAFAGLVFNALSRAFWARRDERKTSKTKYRSSV